MSYPSGRLSWELSLLPATASYLATSHCLFSQGWRLWTQLVFLRSGWFQAEKRPRGSSLKLSCAQSMLSGRPFGAHLLVEVYCVSITLAFYYKSRTSISRNADWFPTGSFRVHWGFCFPFTGGEKWLELLREYLEEFQMLTQNTMNPVSLLEKVIS